MESVPLHIAFIVNGIGTRDRIVALLQEASDTRFHIEIQEDIASYRRLREAGSADFVLLGLSSCDANAADLPESIVPLFAEAPVILLTDVDDDKLAVKAAHKGAQDCLHIETLTSARLVRAVLFAVERNRIRQALRDIEAHNAAILTGALDCIITMNHEGRVVEWNMASELTFGYCRADALGKELASLIIPERLRDAHRNGLAGYLAGGEGPVIDTRIEVPALRADGTEFPVELTVVRVQRGAHPRFIANVRDISESKRHEATQKLNHIVIEQMPTGFVIADASRPDYPIIFANPAFERITGYSNAEVIGSNCRFLQGPDTEPEAVDAIRQAVKTGGECQVTLKNYRKNGTPFWNDLHISAIFDAQGSVTHFVGIQNDITERIAGEREQKLLADYNHLLLQSTGEGIYGVDTEGNCTFLNLAGARILGADPKEIIGRNMHDVTHHSYPDGSDYPYEACPIFQAFNTGRGCRVDNEFFFRADGTAFPVEYSSFPILEGDEVRGAVVTFSDITERKQTQDALQTSEARYQRIAANVPGMVYQFVLRTDGSFAFPFVSEFSRELYGIEPEVIRANPMTLIDIIHPDDKTVFDQSVADSARTLQPWRWTGRFLHHRGEYRWIEGASRPKQEANGDILWDGLLVDITSRKQAEEEIRQAKEAAEAATVAKSEFLATMSHEIRTPMNAVIGMTGLLLDTPMSREQREYAQIIRDSGDALLTIINDILDYSKIEAGQLELEAQPFDLRDCLESSLDIVANRAAEKEIELAYVMEPGVPATAVGDVTRLRQILMNLLSNAIKFTEKGEVIVSVSSNQLSDERFEFHFGVRDTGIGIPEDRMHRLFRSFSQVDASTTRRYGGTGLGLAISKRLCELMQGRIWVESQVGIGSTFHVAIPLAKSEPLMPPLELTPPHLEGRRILIVDDNPTNRQILTLQSQSWGMIPQESPGGEDVLQRLARGERFDIAILDIQMPEMDGVTLATEIRRVCGPDDMFPLIGLSSVNRRLSEFAGAGFATMLAKPIKQSQLYNVLAQVFAGMTQPPQASSSASVPKYDATLGQRMPLRILMGEDLVVNQKLLQLLLGKFGYRADIASNGLEVLKALERQSYDLVLMDVQMPEMDGLEASRRIGRQIPAARRPRIVALTANAMREDQAACQAAGMDDYLSKPINPRMLHNALLRCGEWLRERHASSEPLPADQVLRDESPPAHTQPAPAASVIDPGSLEELRSMGDMLPELIDVFQTEVVEQLEALRAALRNGDARKTADAAHAIKGAASNMGGKSLAAVCASIERQGRASSLADVPGLLLEVETQFRLLCADLDRER